MYVYVCLFGLDGLCWKFECWLEFNFYVLVWVDCVWFLLMVEVGCENNFIMVCWQVVSEYYEFGEMECVWDYVDWFCWVGFSDGCVC